LRLATIMPQPALLPQPKTKDWALKKTGLTLRNSNIPTNIPVTLKSLRRFGKSSESSGRNSPFDPVTIACRSRTFNKGSTAHPSLKTACFTTTSKYSIDTVNLSSDRHFASV
jgi:hypothetical protein